METKICNKCGLEKPLSEFHKCKVSKDGCTLYCKTCKKIYDEKYNISNKSKIKKRSIKYYKGNKEEINKRHMRYYEENKKEIKGQRKRHRDEYKEKINERNRKWNIEHPEYHVDYSKKYNKEYYKRNALYDTYELQLKKYEEIRKDPNNPNYLQVKCKETDCRRWFNPTNQEIQTRIQGINDIGGRNFYCSEECKQNCSIFYKSKYPKDFKHNYSREVQPELRELVLQRDNYECKRCGNRKNLQAHHYESIYFNPVMSADIEMCVTLCKTCHKLAHKDIGCRPIDLTRENLCRGNK